jgi:dolichol-phosphate mannosyltransferase/undecaprenyl-phosphate 4-deoxy-4-formamido-L-arabinose transferase
MADASTNLDCDLSVVIPLYRSGDCFAALMQQLTAALDDLKRSYEIILVDDGSPDDTWQVVRRTLPNYPKATAIQLMRNRGQAFATLCGLSHARGRIVVTMDDDLQHRPTEIRKLLAELEGDSGLDCVFGCFAEKKHATYRNFGSLVVGWLLRKTFNLPADLRSSTFRAMRWNLVRAVLEHRTANPAMAVLIFNSTSHVKSIAVEHAQRYAGQSNYTLSKQFRLALDSICNITIFPLRAISITGMGACVVSFLLAFAYLYKYLTGAIGVPGWTTVVILQCLFAGITLLALGIFGEYMVRILREVRGTPRYVEREQITGEQQK